MKYLLLLVVCFSSLTLFAQEPQREQIPPGITIGKHKWEPAGAGPSVDPSMKAESDSPTGDSSGTSSQETQFRERQAFVYSLEIKNDGAKAIKAIRWDYVITNKLTGEELGRHEFETLGKIGRDKTKRLTARSRVSPTRILPAEEPDKDAMVERVVLTCVVYEDGSLWQLAGTPQQLCDGIRKRVAN